MKKLWKTLVSLTIVLTLSVGVSAAVFAADAGSDISLEDILDILSSLTTEDVDENVEGFVEDVVEEVVQDVEIEAIPEGTDSLNGVSYVVPDDFLSLGEADGTFMYMDPTLTTSLAISFFEASPGEDISLDNELNQKILIAGITGAGVDASDYNLIDIDGHNALNVQYSQDVESLTVFGRAIIIQLDNGLFVAAYSSALSDPSEQYEAFLESISIESDASADTTGAEISFSPDMVGGADAPADAIDATTMDEVVLIDDDLCKVSLKSFTYPEDSNWYGFNVKVYVENKSDQDLRFSTEYTTLNGYVINPYWSESVASGHKTNSEMTFYLDDMNANNITEVSELAFKLSIEDSSYNELEGEFFTILPFGTSVAPQPEQVFPENPVVIADNELFTIIVTGDVYSDNWDTCLPVYIENHTDKVITLSAYGSSAVNGYEITPYIYGYIPGGKKMNTTIEWDIDDLENNDIDTIETVELDLTVRDAEDWYADDIFEGVIEFELN